MQQILAKDLATCHVFLSLSFQRKPVKSGTVAYIISSSQMVGRWNGQWCGLVELLMEFEK
jgi:hypothetical protein